MKNAPTKRTLALLTWVLLLIAIPTGLYVSHVFDQLGEVRENNLRTLSKAAKSTDEILQRAVNNVKKLEKKPKFVCEFLKRQPYLEWGGDGDCPDIKDLDDNDQQILDLIKRFSKAELRASADGVQVWVGKVPSSKDNGNNNGSSVEYVFNVQWQSLLEDIPFSEALDLLFIADAAGNVIHQHKPEGRLDVGLLVSSLDKLPTGKKDEYTDKNMLRRASSINSVRLSGVDYQMLCQPLTLGLTANHSGAGTAGSEKSDTATEEADNDADVSEKWVLCGLVASERSLQQSLTVAPFLAFMIFSVTVFGILTWPAIKLLWMSNRDRLYFADLCFLLFGTMGGLMLATILILGTVSHRNLVKASQDSLIQLADEIDYNLQEELDSITSALHDIDENLRKFVVDDKQHIDEDSKLNDVENLYASWRTDSTDSTDSTESTGSSDHTRRFVEPVRSLTTGEFATIVSIRSAVRVHEHPDSQNSQNSAEPPDSSVSINWTKLMPNEWPIKSDFVFAFWADCNGLQFFKATVQEQNTPRVNIRNREYFQAVLRNRLWGKNEDTKTESGNVAGYEHTGHAETESGNVAGHEHTGHAEAESADVAGHEHTGHAETESAVDKIRDCVRIAAAQANLVSTSNPVLPPGVGFAIIDHDGTALFHSDERRALFENLYEELDDGERLKSFVLARSEGSMNTSYLARPHQVFVKPMETMPWSIVTFSDRELISTVNLEILGHATMIAFIFLLIYAFLALCFCLLHRAEVPLWFWPGSHGGKISQWSVGIPAAALIVLIILIASQEGEILLAAAFCVPLLIFIGIYVVCRQTFRRMPGAGRSSDVQPSQVRLSIASSLMVWIVVAIIPAGIFFKVAIDSQSRVLVRYENEYLVEQVVARNCAIDDYYWNIDLSGLCKEDQGGNSNCLCTENGDDCRLESRRAFTAGDLYPSSMFWPTPRTPRGESVTTLAEKRFQLPIHVPQSKLHRGHIHAGDLSGCEVAPKDADSWSIWNYLADTKPIYNPTVVRSRYLGPDTQVDLTNNTCWSWQPGPEGDTSTFTAGPLACGTMMLVKSKLPLRPIIFVDWVLLTIGAILLGMLFFWTRYGVRHLFFGDLQMPPLRDREGLEQKLLEKPNDTKVLLIALAASRWDRSNLLNPPDLDSSNGDREPSSSHGQHARYDMMDYVAGPTKRRKLLKELENDIDAGKNVLIVSPVDPYSLLPADEHSLLPTDESPVPEDHTQTTWFQAVRDEHEELFRWRQILSMFRVVVVSINLSPPQQVWKGNWQRKLDRDVSTEWLKADLGALPELDQLYGLLEPELIGSTRRNALDRIVERAFGNYMALWDACSEGEKLVLVQLAFENVVNPKQVAIVRRLIQRGLIVRDPRLRVMNQSFSQFIAEIHDPSTVKEWEHKASGTSWVHKRWALLGILLLGMLFLWATQRELFNTTLMFLSAAAVGLPGVIRLVTNLTKLGSQGGN